jgi:hypothetical protein
MTTSAGSATTALFIGGYSSDFTNVIDYVTISSAGDATDFGDLTVRNADGAACSNSTRAVVNIGEQVSVGIVNTIEYVTIASAGNATDFGDLTQARGQAGACASSTRGVWGGGSPTFSRVNTIDYVTISSTSNATDFGDLTQSTNSLAGASNATRGLFAAGIDSSVVRTNVISYITIASTGDATFFGDLTVTRNAPAGASSSIRAVFGGGRVVTPSNTPVNVMDYVTIASTGNATDFGDLTVIQANLGGTSNAHGGL